MIISINKKLQKYFEDDKALAKKYGPLSSRIKTVYSMLKLADNLKEIPETKPTLRHKLSGNKSGCWSIGIKDNWKMVIRPIKITDDLEQIKEIEICSIEDYH